MRDAKRIYVVNDEPDFDLDMLYARVYLVEERNEAEYIFTRKRDAERHARKLAAESPWPIYVHPVEIDWSEKPLEIEGKLPEPPAKTADLGNGAFLAVTGAAAIEATSIAFRTPDGKVHRRDLTPTAKARVQ